jgi:diadenosine tetraphosphate (Ap4A) HIT family hydrolase
MAFWQQVKMRLLVEDDWINESEMQDCVFCKHSLQNGEIFLQNATFAAIFDKYPVNPGHSLLIPKRHVISMFDLFDQEWFDLRSLLKDSKDRLDVQFSPAGYNVGINCGLPAGQTVEHLHVHLIPRYLDDVGNPKGGIRNFKAPIVPLP